MHFDAESRVCRSQRSSRHRSPGNSQRRASSFRRREASDRSVNDEPINTLEDAAENEWNQQGESHQEARRQRELYRPDWVQSSYNDNQGNIDTNDNEQVESSDTNEIRSAVQNPNAVVRHSQQERIVENSIAGKSKTGNGLINVEDVLKRGDVGENQQLIPSADNSESIEEVGPATEAKSIDPANNRNAFDQGYIAANNEEQGFQGDSGQVSSAFQIENDAQHHGLMKRVADSIGTDWDNKLSGVETDDSPTGTKDMLKRDRIEHDHQSVSSEGGKEGSEENGVKLFDATQNRYADNERFSDSINNELAFLNDSAQFSDAFQSQNEAQSHEQMMGIGGSNIADWTNQASALESDTAPVGEVGVLKRDEVAENQLVSDAYSDESSGEDGLREKGAVKNTEQAARNKLGQFSVGGRDLNDGESYGQTERVEESSTADWSSEVSANDSSIGTKVILKRGEVEHGAGNGEGSKEDDLEGYNDMNNNEQAISSDPEQLSAVSGTRNGAQSSDQTKRLAKSSGLDGSRKVSDVETNDGPVGAEELFKRDESERSYPLISSADTNEEGPGFGEEELSDSGATYEETGYNQLQKSGPHYYRQERRDDVADISAVSDTVKSEAQDDGRKEDVAAKSYTSDAGGSEGSLRTLSLSHHGSRFSENRRGADDVSKNEANQVSNDGESNGASKATDRYYEGAHLREGSENEHSKIVAREASSSSVLEASSLDENKNSVVSHEPHESVLEEEDEILKQLSNMKQRNTASKTRNGLQGTRERLERSKSSRDKEIHNEDKRGIVSLKPEEEEVLEDERANEQVDNQNPGDTVVPSSPQAVRRSWKRIKADKGQTGTISHNRHSKEKMSFAGRHHNEKETQGHFKREKSYRRGAEEQDSQSSLQTAERSAPERTKQKLSPRVGYSARRSDEAGRSRQQKAESSLNIDQIIKDAERFARMKVVPRRPATEYLDKQKRYAGDTTGPLAVGSDPDRVGENEDKESIEKITREVAEAKPVSNVGIARRAAGSGSLSADRARNLKVHGRISAEFVGKNPDSTLIAGTGSEKENRRQDREAIAESSYEDTGKKTVSVQKNQKPEDKSTRKDTETQMRMRGTDEYDEEFNKSLERKAASPTRDSLKSEKKRGGHDTKRHAIHRAASTKESGLYQSGYISIGPMNKLARFQRNGRNVIYDVTSLSNNKVRDKSEYDSPYAFSSERRSVHGSPESTDAGSGEEDVSIRAPIFTKRNDSVAEGKRASSDSDTSFHLTANRDRKRRKQTKHKVNKALKGSRHENREAASVKEDEAEHLHSLSSLDDQNNKSAEAPVERARSSDKAASKRALTKEGPSRSVQGSNYEEVSSNATVVGVAGSAKRAGDVKESRQLPLLSAIQNITGVAPYNAQQRFPDAAFHCPGSGSYPHPNDDRAYYTCVPTADGTGFEAQLSSCLHNQVFDRLTRTCVSRDVMARAASNQSTQSTSSTVRSEAPPAPEPLENPCTTEGRISNQYDCSAFYLCLPKGPGSGGDFFHIALRCPTGNIFDADSHQCVEGSATTCVPEYKMLDKLRRRRGRIRAQLMSRGTRSEEDACPRPGRFARADGACEDYILCARLGGVGPLLAVPVHCPTGLAFSEESGRCVNADVADCQPEA